MKDEAITPMPQLQLENQLCFTIYACSREITKLYQPYLDKLGVTYSQYLVLLVLWERGSCTVSSWGRLCIWTRVPLHLYSKEFKLQV